MDLQSLIEKSLQKENPIIEKEKDPLKYTEMVNKLCLRRKELEKLLAEGNTPTQAETLSSLMFLKNSMATFGISEIDYQAYLVNQEKEETKETESQTLSLFS